MGHHPEIREKLQKPGYSLTCIMSCSLKMSISGGHLHLQVNSEGVNHWPHTAQLWPQYAYANNQFLCKSTTILALPIISQVRRGVETRWWMWPHGWLCPAPQSLNKGDKEQNGEWAYTYLQWQDGGAKLSYVSVWLARVSEHVGVCVCVCMSQRERKGTRERQRNNNAMEDHNSSFPITPGLVAEVVFVQIGMWHIVSTCRATQLTKPNWVGHIIIMCVSTLTSSKHKITQQ